MLKTDKSQKIIRKAEKVTPGGVNSPVRAFQSVGGTPRIIKKGEGAYMTDVDDNSYIDFSSSWGPLILGHADKDVVKAVQDQCENGMTYGT